MPTDPADLKNNPASQIGQATIQRMVTEHLRSLVLQGRIAPGTRILQTDLAEELGVSTTPVREALRELTTEGLVDSHPHRGATAHQPSRDELMDLYEMRMSLEPIVLKAVIERITPEAISAAMLLISTMEQETEVPRWCEMNGHFHKLIDKASERPLLVATLAKLRDLSSIYIARSIQNAPERMASASTEHRNLLAALMNRDLQTAQEQERRHLEKTLEFGLTYLESARI